ncbi:hypothetical protein BC829DRAFT_416437 [Chytridium lagenaria]|nr:hypothetical protein BC829DRAFT_416437 [Chytridium lagenaria]
MDNSTGPIRSAPRAEKNKDDDGRPPKRTMSNEKDLPKAQAKLLKTTSVLPGEEEQLEEAVERNHQDEEMDEVEQPPHPPLPTPTDWNTLHLWMDDSSAYRKCRRAFIRMQKGENKRYLEVLAQPTTPTNSNKGLRQSPPHTSPKDPQQTSEHDGPTHPMPALQGTLSQYVGGFWIGWESQMFYHAKIGHGQDDTMSGKTGCYIPLDVLHWTAKTGNKAQLATIFQRLFATIPIRKAPPPRMNLEAANHKAASAIAALLQNTEDTLNFKEVQTTIQAQQTYIKGLEDHNQHCYAHSSRWHTTSIKPTSSSQCRPQHRPARNYTKA